MSVTRSFRRAASRWMIPQSSLSSVGERRATRAASRWSREIDPSGLRISCASPAAMRPSTREALGLERARGGRLERAAGEAEALGEVPARSATTQMPSPLTSSG